MEDRTLLATMYWTNSDGGDWDTASNWVNSADPSDEHVPTASDDAVIDLSGVVVTHGSSASDAVNSLTIDNGASLSLSAGSLALSNASTVAGLDLGGGTLSTADTLTVPATGTMTWTGGTITGGGSLAIASGASLAMGTNPGYTETLDGAAFQNDGSATITYGSVQLLDGASVTNQGTVTFADSGGVYAGDSSSTSFTNQGSIVSDPADGGGVSIDSPFSQTSGGSVSVQAGSFGIATNIAETVSGSITTAAGTTLYVTGTFAFDGSSSIASSGTVYFGSNSTVTYDGSYSSADTMVGSSAVTFEADSTVTGLGSDLNIGGGSILTVDSAQPLSFDTLELTGGGSLSGDGGSLTVTGAMAWDNGALSGFSSLDIASGATLTLGLAGSNQTESLSAMRLLVAGSLVANGPLQLLDGASVVNRGTVTFADSGGVYAGDSSSTSFTNQGSIVSDPADGGGVSIDSPFSQTSGGSVSVQAGSFGIATNIAETVSGSITTAAGTTLYVTGTFTFDGSSSIASSGTVYFGSNSTVTYDGSYSSADTMVGSSAVTFEADSTVTGLGSDLNIGGGSILTVDSAQPLSFDTLELTGGGSLSGDGGSLTVTGAMAWDNGALSGFSSLDIASGATLTLGLAGSNQTESLSAMPLLAAGSLVANGPLQLLDGASVTNQGTATFADSGGVYAGDSSSTSFTNQGSIVSDPADGGGVSIDSPFSQTSGGSVSVQAGSFGIATNIAETVSGSITTAAGTTLYVTGTFTFDGSSSIASSGTVYFGNNSTVTYDGSYDSAETIVNSSSITFGPDADITGLGSDLNIGDSSLTGNGGALTVVGSMSWQGGTISGFSALVVPSGTSLAMGSTAGVQTETLVGVALQNAGTVTLAGSSGYGAMVLDSGASVDNQAGATFTVTSSLSITGDGSPGEVLSNEGTLVYDPIDAAYTPLVLPFAQSSTGQTEVQAGEFGFSAGGTIGGSLAISAGALIYAGGPTSVTYAFPLGSSVSGAGTFFVVGVAVTIDGTYDVTGTTAVTAGYGASIEDGSLTFPADSTITTLGSTLEVYAYSSLSIASSQDFTSFDTLLVQGALTGGGGALGVLDTGSMSWGGGTISGFSGVTIPVDATLTIDDSVGTLVGLALDNYGTATAQDTVDLDDGASLVNESGAGLTVTGAFNIALAGSSSVVNQSGAVFTIAAPLYVTSDGTTTTFVNDGSLVQTDAVTGLSEINVAYDQSGTGSTEADGGSLLLGSGGTISGPLTVASGATLYFGGPGMTAPSFALDASTSITGAGGVVVTGPVTDDGTYSISGTTEVYEGSLTFPADAALADMLTEVDVYGGGALTIDGGQDFTFGILNLQGTLTGGGGSLTVTNSFGWDAGTVTGFGLLTVAQAATFTLSPGYGGTSTLDGVTLDNEGTATLTGGVVAGADGGTFNNEAQGTFNFDIPPGGACCYTGFQDIALNNYGTIDWTSGNLGTGDGVFNNEPGATFNADTDGVMAGEAFNNLAGASFDVANDGLYGDDMELVFNNAGAVDVTSGTLALGIYLEPGSAVSSGSFDGAPGTSIGFSISQDFTATSSIDAANVSFVTGSYEIEGTYSVSGVTDLDVGGHVSFTGTVADVGSTLDITPSNGDATANFSPATPTTLTVGECSLMGTLTGTDSFIVTGTLNLEGGTISTAGTVAAQGGMTITGGQVEYATLANDGAATWNGGPFTLADGASFVNEPGASFTIQGNGSIQDGGGTPSGGSFVNAGTVSQTGGTGTTYLDVPLTQQGSGSVMVGSGALSLTGGLTSGPGTPADAPAITSADYIATSSSGGLTIVDGTLAADPDTTYVVLVLADPGGGQPLLLLGSLDATTDASGNASFTATIATPNIGSDSVLATATDPSGNTSALGGELALQPATGTTSIALNVTANSQQTQTQLQQIVGALQDVPAGSVAPTVVLQPADTGQTANVFDAINDLPAAPSSSTSSVTVSVDLGNQAVSGTTLDVPAGAQVVLGGSDANIDQATITGGSVTVGAGVTPSDWTVDDGTVNVQGAATAGDFVVNGGTVTLSDGTVITGNSPAIIVNGGTVNLDGVTAQTATAAPTIIVESGSLVVRDSVIQESTTATEPAILITGGSVDLGTTDDPGGNTINVNGTGEFVHNDTSGTVPAVGDVFEINGTALSAPELSFTSLASSANTTVYGQGDTFTVTVRRDNPGDPAPSGLVEITGLPLSKLTSMIWLVDGTATFSAPVLDAGTYHVSVGYQGNSQYLPSLDSLTLTVDAASTTTGLTPSVTSAMYGTSVKLSAAVAAQAPGSGTSTGMVEFLDGTKPLLTVALDGTGAASYTATGLSVGVHDFTAVYQGVNDFATSTSVIEPVTITTPLSLSAIAPVSPSVRNSPVSSVDVTFSEAVNSSSFSSSDLTLTDNGNAVHVSGVSLTLVSGTTYAINGLGALTKAEGSYSLTVSAATIQDTKGNPGTGSLSVSWLMDTTPPTSTIAALVKTGTSLNFPLTISGTDPNGANGSTASGLVDFTLYEQVNGGAWQVVPGDGKLAPTLTSGGISSVTVNYPGASNTSYAFYATATDAAGNTQADQPTIEAYTYLPDLTPPVTSVTAASTVNTSTGTFTLQLSGTAPGGKPLTYFEVFVGIDLGGGGNTKPVGVAIPAGFPDANGVYHATITYQGLADGCTHTYSFTSLGIDGAGLVQPLPQATPVAFTESFHTPSSLQVTGLTVENGASERSYIRYLDVNFNETGGALATLAGDPGSAIQLYQYDLNGDASSKAAVSLSGVTANVVDHAIELDFGAGGIGNGASSTAADGYYELDVTIGTTTYTHFFYRLLGDVTGDGVVNNNDLAAIASELALSSPAGDTPLSADVNGDGSVTQIDETIATRSKGRQLKSTLKLG